jgi:hypothetical protein
MYRIFTSGILCCFLSFVATTVSADEKPPEEEWEFGVQINAWLPDVTAEDQSGSKITIPIDEILDDLKMTAMFTLTADYNKWHLYSDFVYVNLDKKSDSGLSDVGLKAVVSNTGVGYKVYDTDNLDVHLTAGFTYIKLEHEISVLNLGAKGTDENWDGVVGFKGQYDINEDWYLSLWSQVGAGDSDYTWLAQGGVHYRFGFADAVVGYKHEYWKFDGALKESYDSGAYLGLKFNF